MAENSKIEWCDHTFNPWMGCTKVSAGCKNCYAETMMDKRYNKVEWGKGKSRILTSEANWKLPLRWDKKAHLANIRELGKGFENISKAFTPEFESRHVKFNRPKVFCASLADVFDEEVSDEWRYRLFALIQQTQNLDWLVLTKRPTNAKRFILEYLDKIVGSKTIYFNLWIGTSVENQETADERIPQLLQIPAAKRFLSMEPLLGPVDFYQTSNNMPTKGHPWRNAPILTDIHWVIVGGESGRNARPMNPDWVRSIRNQCLSANVKFFFKQWGEWKHLSYQEWIDSRNKIELELFNEAWDYMGKVGKVKAGRLLDGVEYNDMPEVE